MSTSAQLAKTPTNAAPSSGFTWTLRAGAGSIRLAVRSAVGTEDTRSSWFEVLPYLRGWIADPLTRDFLFGMYRAVYGREWPAQNTRENSEYAELLVDSLAAALRSGLLVVVEGQAAEPGGATGKGDQLATPAKVWRIAARGRDVTLGIGTQAAPGQRILAPPVLIGHLDQWLAKPGEYGAITDLYGEAFHVHAALRPRLTDPAQRAAARERLAQAILAGTIVGLVEHTLGSAESDTGASTPQPPAKSEQRTVEEKTWFECQLLDEDGEPMANEKYSLIDSDGGRHEGKLDAQGKVYIPPMLNPGMCTISFPEIHLNPRKKK